MKGGKRRLKAEKNGATARWRRFVEVRAYYAFDMFT